MLSGAQGSTRQKRTAIDIRGLLQNREFIKTTTYVLPRRTKLQVLEMMERLRLERTAPAATALPNRAAAPLPEMTGGELVREINWRIGTLPPEDAEVLARYIRHLTRWRARRTQKRGAQGPPDRPRPISPDLTR